MMFNIARSFAAYTALLFVEFSTAQSDATFSFSFSNTYELKPSMSPTLPGATEQILAEIANLDSTSGTSTTLTPVSLGFAIAVPITVLVAALTCFMYCRYVRPKNKVSLNGIELNSEGVLNPTRVWREGSAKTSSV